MSFTFDMRFRHISGNFTIFLLVQSLLHLAITCLGLTYPSKYCYKDDPHYKNGTNGTSPCRWHRLGIYTASRL